MRHAVLNFHGIGTPGRTLEEGEAPYWIDRDFFCRILDLVLERQADMGLCLTFDDGNASDLEIAMPEMDARGLKAEIFVLSGRLDMPGALGPEDVRTLEAGGHRIGTHGIAHVDWSALDPAGLSREIDASREALGALCGRIIDAAAIPFGRYNGRVIAALKRAGLTRIYTSDGGACRPGARIRPRTSVTAAMDIAAVRGILDGREPALRTLRRHIAGAIKRTV